MQNRYQLKRQAPKPPTAGTCPRFHTVLPCSHNIIITVFTEDCNHFDQRKYDDVISGIQFHAVACTCGHSGGLTRHGFYERTFKFRSRELRLRILRVICSNCGHTHAVLLSIFVPYSQIPFHDQKTIIQDVEAGRNPSHVMDKNICIDENNILSIVRSYRRHWKQRLLSAGICLDADIVKPCFANYSRQFMQIRNTRNILFIEPT